MDPQSFIASANVSSEMFEVVYDHGRDLILLPLLKDIEAYDPADRTGMGFLITRVLATCRITQMAFAAELGTTRFNISKWENGVHRPLKPMRIKLKALLMQKVLAQLTQADQLAHASKAN